MALAAKKEVTGKKRKPEGEADGKDSAAKRARAAKPHADLVVQMKQLWELARVTKLDTDKRVGVVKQLVEAVKGKVVALAVKRDGSLVLQTVFKYGSEKQRTLLVSEIQPHVISLIKGHYSKFLVRKAFKYANSPGRRLMLSQLHGHMTELVRHKEAASVVDHIYQEYATPKQRTALVEEFYGPEYALFKDPEKPRGLNKVLEDADGTKKASIVKNIADTVERLVNKGTVGQALVHHIMLDWIRVSAPSSLPSIVGALKDVIPFILHTRDGAAVACHVIGASTAKDRKAILKSMKGMMVRAALEEYGHAVIMRLLTCVDDTKLLNTAVVSELVAGLGELAQSQYGLRTLAIVLCPSVRRYFTPDVLALMAPIEGPDGPTSRKEPSKRRRELLTTLSPHLLTFVEAQVGNLILDPVAGPWIADVLRYAYGDKTGIVSALKTAVQESQDSEDGGTELLDSAVSSRVLKGLAAWGSTAAPSPMEGVELEEEAQVGLPTDWSQWMIETLRIGSSELDDERMMELAETRSVFVVEAAMKEGQSTRQPLVNAVLRLKERLESLPDKPGVRYVLAEAAGKKLAQKQKKGGTPAKKTPEKALKVGTPKVIQKKKTPRKSK